MGTSFPYFGKFEGFFGFLNAIEFLFSYFPLILNFTHSMVWRLYVFLLDLKYLRNPLTLECLCHPMLFPYYGNSFFSYFREFHGFLLHPKYLRSTKLWNVCIFPCFSRTMGIQFWEIDTFPFILNSLRSPSVWNFCVFRFFSLIWACHFLHISEIACVLPSMHCMHFRS